MHVSSLLKTSILLAEMNWDIILAFSGPTHWKGSKKCIKIILFDEQKFDQRTLGDVTKLECVKISANNRVMLDLSVADIIANVET